ncbi:MAG TPA: RNA methyltransferase [Beijerinckiaceae bacterium]
MTERAWQIVVDPDDPRVEAYRSIRERDLVGRQGRFVAEGEVVLRVLVERSHFPIESVLASAARAKALTPLLAKLPAEVPIYVADPPVLDRVAGFSIHRGLLAIGRRGPETNAAARLAALPERALVVGLVGIANHDNMGGIFRNAAAFGADLVLLDETSCDPLYRKAIRVSVGGALVVPFARAGSADDLVSQLAAAGFELFALSPAGEVTLDQLSPAPRTALLLGAEGPGLPAAVLERTRRVSIPMAGGFDSLNVATASGIALHHVFRHQDTVQTSPVGA